MVHDPKGSGQNNEAELAARKDVADPFLKVSGRAIKTWANRSALVKATVEVDDDLSGAVVVDNFKVRNIPVLLHHLQKLHHNFAAGTNEYLAFSAALCACDAAKRIRQDAH